MSSFKLMSKALFVQAKVQGYAYHWALSPALGPRIWGAPGPAKDVWQR